MTSGEKVPAGTPTEFRQCKGCGRRHTPPFDADCPHEQSTQGAPPVDDTPHPAETTADPDGPRSDPDGAPAMIDPTAGDLPADGKVGRESIVPAGMYLLGLVWFQRRESHKGNVYYRCLYEVVAGNHSGDGFFSGMGLDTTKRGAVSRWMAWARCLGIREKFDPREDETLERLFKGRVFKARVSKEGRTGREGERYWTNDITRYVYDLSPQERQTAAAWEAEFQERRTGWEEGTGLEDGPDMMPPATTGDDGIPF